MPHERDRLDSGATRRRTGKSPEPMHHDRGIPALLRQAGNAAVTQALQGKAPLAIQRQLAGLRMRDDLDLRRGPILPREEPAVDPLPSVKPKILAWLEPQRNRLESRAMYTGMAGMSPDQGISMPELVAMVREHVPESLKLQPRQIAEIIREWTHVMIPEHKFVGGRVADSEIEAAVQNALGKPGTVRVERPGRAWMEITAGGIELGHDDKAAIDATMTVAWDGSVGASLTAANVKGSFQISPNRTWQAQIAIPAGATVAVLNQISNVFHAADGAARSVAGRVDAAGGKVHGVAVDVLRDGLSPVKDAIDTLSSITDKENPVSVGITASGDFGGGIAVQATVTIRW